MFLFVHSRGCVWFLIAAFSAGNPNASQPIVFRLLLSSWVVLLCGCPRYRFCTWVLGLPILGSGCPILRAFCEEWVLGLPILGSGCPRRGVCAWVLGSLLLGYGCPRCRFCTWV